jgi:hypothetical protein
MPSAAFPFFFITLSDDLFTAEVRWPNKGLPVSFITLFSADMRE